MTKLLIYAALGAGLLLWWLVCIPIAGQLQRTGLPTIVQVLVILGLAWGGPIGVGLLCGYLGQRVDVMRRQGRPNDMHRIVARMRKATAPTLLMVPARSGGFSKLGGLPDLPKSVTWPSGENAPRTFVAQIDLAVVAASGAFPWLPTIGRLHLFVDNRRAGFSDYGVVLFGTEIEATDVAPPGKPPEQFKERRVAFLPMQSVPSLDWLGVDVTDLNVSDAELDQLAGLPNEPFGDEVQHRIGGYPAEIQDSQMQIECELLRRGLSDTPQAEASEAVRRASKQWRMLLQIDADPNLGMTWGDAGRLYVFVRKNDAERGDFSKSITLWQTH